MRNYQVSRAEGGNRWSGGGQISEITAVFSKRVPERASASGLGFYQGFAAVVDLWESLPELRRGQIHSFIDRSSPTAGRGLRSAGWNKTFMGPVSCSSTLRAALKGKSRN